MFGWIALLATGYAKGHGLIPNGDVPLDLKEWGTLAYLYGGSISNERAIIMVGHLHLLLLSVCAAVSPLSFQDKLYLEPGEEQEPAAGLIPKASPGLTASVLFVYPFYLRLSRLTRGCRLKSSMGAWLCLESLSFSLHPSPTRPLSLTLLTLVSVDFYFKYEPC
jgi:hypothetical protein